MKKKIIFSLIGLSIIIMFFVGTELTSRGGSSSSSKSKGKEMLIHAGKVAVRYKGVVLAVGNAWDTSPFSERDTYITQTGRNTYNLDQYMSIVVDNQNYIKRIVIFYAGGSIKQKIKGGESKLRFKDKIKKVRKAFPDAVKGTWTSEGGNDDTTYFLMDQSMVFTTQKDTGQNGLVIVQFHTPDDLNMIINHMKQQYSLVLEDDE